MSHMQSDLLVDSVPVVRLQSDSLQVDVVPSVGGRIISVINRRLGHEFLWRNSALRLERLPSGSAYDPNFYGGIDELLPNDLAESLNGVVCPDHGELWTTPLDWELRDDRLYLQGRLPIFGLIYEREMKLLMDRPGIEINYRLTNPTSEPREFLWKLHAALAIQAGDQIECPARSGQVVDAAWSRFKDQTPFCWPMIEGVAANIVPPRNDTMDFFYLFDLERGTMAWRRPDPGLMFAYQFDPSVFPYAWLFASYGGFEGHYTAILEPCTAMPLSVPEAAAKKQCSLLEPGAALITRVRLWAGRTSDVEAQLASGGIS